MRLAEWLRERRLRNLREQLAVVRASIAAYENFAIRCGTIFPAVMESNARELARIQFRIAEIEARSGAGALAPSGVKEGER